MLACNAIISGFLSRRFAYLVIYVKTSKSYSNNASAFIAINIAAFKMHLVVKLIVSSLSLTVPSLCLSYKCAMAKFMYAFILHKDFIARTNGSTM